LNSGAVFKELGSYQHQTKAPNLPGVWVGGMAGKLLQSVIGRDGIPMLSLTSFYGNISEKFALTLPDYCLRTTA
jgi:hypothetical protein